MINIGGLYFREDNIVDVYLVRNEEEPSRINKGTLFISTITVHAVYEGKELDLVWNVISNKV